MGKQWKHISLSDDVECDVYIGDLPENLSHKEMMEKVLGRITKALTEYKEN